MLEQAFLDFGYTKDEYEKIRNTFPVINLRDETLLNNFQNTTKFLLNNGYTKSDIIKMAKIFPSLFGIGTQSLRKKIEFMVSLGYERETVLKMTKRLPALFGYNIENIKQRIKNMVMLGFTKEEIIEMTSISPAIFSYGIDRIIEKMTDLETLGYTKKEVIRMIKLFPALLGSGIESIREKVKFYDSINMHELLIVDPKDFMQSTKLSYARYEFYKVKGIKIDMTNYRKLFLGSKRFENQYGITKEEILEKYKYEDYIKTESKAK